MMNKIWKLIVCLNEEIDKIIKKKKKQEWSSETKLGEIENGGQNFWLILLKSKWWNVMQASLTEKTLLKVESIGRGRYK